MFPVTSPFDSIPLYAESRRQMAAPPPGITAGFVAPPVMEIQSPMATTEGLTAIVWADLLGEEFVPITRAAAMALPAIARQRHLVAGSLARCPLVALTGDTPDPDQPRWLYRTDTLVSPYHRMLWTVDDLIFHGWSLWARTLLANGFPGDAVRVPFERWSFTKTGGIEVDSEPVKATEVILIPGPHEGICNFGQGAIRMARDNAKAASTAARNPSAYLELHYVGDEPQKPEDIDALTARWAAARRGENGGVAYTGKNLEVKEHGTHESHLLIEGRNADAVDMSRLVSSPAAMADATNAGASLTYETSEGRNGQFIDYGVALYGDAIGARLSLDDCIASGHRVALDYAQLRNVDAPTTGSPTAD